jgi:hypothetical protein
LFFFGAYTCGGIQCLWCFAWILSQAGRHGRRPNDIYLWRWGRCTSTKFTPRCKSGRLPTMTLIGYIRSEFSKKHICRCKSVRQSVSPLCSTQNSLLNTCSIINLSTVGVSLSGQKCKSALRPIETRCKSVSLSTAHLNDSGMTVCCHHQWIFSELRTPNFFMLLLPPTRSPRFYPFISSCLLDFLLLIFALRCTYQCPSHPCPPPAPDDSSLAIADASICPLSSLLVDAKLDHLYAIIVVASHWKYSLPPHISSCAWAPEQWTFTRWYVSFAFQPHTVAYFQYRTRAIWSTSLTSGFVS